MSKLQDLLDTLCPDGVQVYRIGDIAQVGTGSSNGNEAIDNGLYPFFIRSQTVKAKNEYEYNDESIIIPGEGGVGEIFHYINGPYALHQRVYRIHFVTTDVNTKFAYYYFREHFQRFIMRRAVNATVTSIRKPMIEDFEIPVPPLPVQEEVVRILDTFTTLEAELEAELSARRKQYEFYREQLLTFRLPASSQNAEAKAETDRQQIDSRLTLLLSALCPNGVEYKRLQDVCDIVRGVRITKSMLTENGVYPVVSGGTGYMGRTNQYNRNENTITIAQYGTAGYVSWRDEKFWANDVCYAVTPYPHINNRFLYHCLLNLQQNIYALRTDAVPPCLPRERLLNITIPVPPLEVQEYIVNVLDKFDALAHDIEIGLPAEIAARRKQYEYYREKLLTFKVA